MMIRKAVRCLTVLLVLSAFSGCITEAAPATTPASPATAAKPAKPAAKKPPSLPSSVDFGRRG